MKAAIFLLVLTMLFSMPTYAYAEGELSDIYDGLPNGAKDALPNELEDELQKENGAGALKLLDASFFMSFLGQALSHALKDTAPMLLTVTVTVLICAMLTALSRDGGGVNRAMSFVSGVSLCSACISVIKPISEQCFGTIEVLSGIIKTSLPIMTSISLAAGQTNLSYANATFLNALLVITEEIGKQILSPLIAACIAFTAVSALSKDTAVDLSHVAASVKKIFIFFISLLSTVLCFTMAFQTVIAKGSDTVLLRSIKFASGSSIPIVGSALSEAAGSYLSGLSLIKGSAGTLIAAAIALSSLPMLLKLFAVKLCLSFAAFISDILGIKGSVIRDFTSICDMLIAMLVTSSLIFVITMGVFASVLPNV